MFTTASEAVTLIRNLKDLIRDAAGVEIAVCPPSVNLIPAAQELKGSSIRLGGQNMHWEEEGAFAGEVSAKMLREAGCHFVILGHSERRQYFGETDETVNRKIRKALSAGLAPILCVGESLQERESGHTETVVKTQLDGGLKGFTADELKPLVIAYEPVWAIGTGKTATPEQAQEVHRFIRGWFEKAFGSAAAGALRIQYGGSVKPDNAKILMSQPDIDGALVGGASLKADGFAAIIKAAAS